MPNYKELVEEQDKELSELDARWQTDADLLYLKDYIMESPPDIGGKRHAIPGIVNSTLNRPAIFGETVVSVLGAVKEQIVVESSNINMDTTKFEEFCTAALQAANRRLLKQGKPLLNAFTDAQVCFRGRTGRRILFREENGLIVPDISNWDGRYIRYGIGDDDLEWAGLKMRRSKRQIEEDYHITIAEKQATLLDVWDREHNEVWVDDKIVKEQKHSYGFTPVVFQIVPTGYGSILLDEGSKKNEGESIFSLIRGVVPQLNSLLSIMETLNFLSVKRPGQYASQAGGQAEAPEYDEVFKPGSMTPVEIGGGIRTIDFGDALRAAELAYNMLEKAIQEGGYTDFDIGNVRQPFSAVALLTIGEGRDQRYLPRLAAKELLNVATAEMIRKQCQQIGGTLRFGEAGNNQTFNSSILSGQWQVGFRYFPKDPKKDLARMALAGQAKEWYPRKYIYENVLQVEDPDGMEDNWYSQIAEEIDPNILKHRIIMKLLKKADEGDEDAEQEWRIMAAGLGWSIEQIKAGILPPQLKPPKDKSAIPLLPEGGRVGGTIPSSAKRAGELRRTPQERAPEESL